MNINAENFKVVAVALNQDARTEHAKVFEQAKEAGVTNIYDPKLPYAVKLRELESFISVTHVMNSLIAKYIELIELRDAPDEGEN